jgi:hypothetical protein
MRTNIRKNQNNQLPTQVEAVQITINEDDVNYAIKKLSLYDDSYSRGIVTVFTSYLSHKEFKKMRDELDEVPRVNVSTYKLWDFSTHAGFLEVIYPVTEKGGCDDK